MAAVVSASIPPVATVALVPAPSLAAKTGHTDTDIIARLAQTAFPAAGWHLGNHRARSVARTPIVLRGSRAYGPPSPHTPEEGSVEATLERLAGSSSQLGKRRHTPKAELLDFTLAPSSTAGSCESSEHSSKLPRVVSDGDSQSDAAAGSDSAYVASVREWAAVPSNHGMLSVSFDCRPVTTCVRLSSAAEFCTD